MQVALVVGCGGLGGQLVGPPCLEGAGIVAREDPESGLREESRKLREALQQCRELLQRTEKLLEMTHRAGGPQCDQTYLSNQP